ncbi:MAG: GNAT family N-acetyltransferase [Archangiaceae bacterium]|nr:GNAT family N-acetyltransferase [Archangiaceae bacterium]
MERLTGQDLPALQSLVEACGDYYQLVFGAEAGPHEAASLMAELPPGRGTADKFMFGFFERTELNGVVDLVRGYREPNEWYLGLLLLRPPLRGVGRGTQILEEVLPWLRAEGATSVRLAVAQQNTDARRFWERHGFVFDKRFPPRQMTARVTVLDELRRSL